MTPQQAIKHLILMRHAQFSGKDMDYSFSLSPEEIEEKFCALVESGERWDAQNEVRGGEVETDVECEWSRHYESKPVAAQHPSGKWVGWTYWYGGGKHSEPEEIEWIEDAYFLECEEEEKTVVVRTFTKLEGGAA